MNEMKECLCCKAYKKEDEIYCHTEVYDPPGECYYIKAFCFDCYDKQLLEEEKHFRLDELKSEKCKSGKVLTYKEFCKKLDLELEQNELLRLYERFYLDLD